MAGARGRQVYETGDVDAGVWSCGLGVGLIKDIPTCKDLAKTIEQDAEEALTKTNALIISRARL